MFLKVIAVALVATTCHAISYEGHAPAQSFAILNHDQHHVQHIYSPAVHQQTVLKASPVAVSAPVYHQPHQVHFQPAPQPQLIHQAVAPIARVALATPIHVAAAPVLHQASSYSNLQHHGGAGQLLATPGLGSYASQHAIPSIHYTSAPRVTFTPAKVAVAPLAVHHAAPLAVHAAPVAKVAVAPVGHHEVHQEEYAYPKYEFAYGVEDHHTGDIHSQHETRDGDVVKGEYSLHEPDGTVRTVKYTADKHNGFNAQVEKSGHSVHQAPVHKIAVAKVAAPVKGYYHH